MQLVKVFDDRQRLGEQMLPVFQCGNNSERIQFLVCRRVLLPTILEQMDGLVFTRQPFQRESNAYSVGSGAAEITVELHSPPETSSTGSAGRIAPVQVPKPTR